ncbi:MAG TPA: mevalonate kinase [Polyangiaceae bacterium]|jgi:mevalonate kinase|nr:mevalonate kinase [Polyangiaceae bacterium]
MARANGKVILLGEHAVVYGVPAIAAGIERGVEATASPAEDSTLRIGERFASVADESELGRAFAALLASLGAEKFRVEANLELPPGSGLGASAALGVAIARAVLSAQGAPEDSERVLAAAAAWEGVYHGNPSGIDAAAAAHSGCLLFDKLNGPRPLLLARDLVLAIGLAGPPASTKLMVESVARQRERRPELFEKALQAIAALVGNAKLCLEAGDLPGLGSLMNYNQMLLSGMFVSTEGIERCCALAREAGALGAKLTGAGGGGAVIALCDGDSAPILAAWRKASVECFASRVRAGSAGDLAK